MHDYIYAILTERRPALPRSLSVRPLVLIWDEPVSALDLSVRAQVMNLLLDLQKKKGVSCLFIAHDLAMVRQAATRVYVMYLGRIVEEGQSADIMADPVIPMLSDHRGTAILVAASIYTPG